jgi:hypothetical protein
MKCKICRKEYKTETGLKKHEKTNNCNHKCLNCLKQFSTKQTLKYHLDKVSCNKKFKCEICLKLFTNKRNMILHTEKHTIDEPKNSEIEQFGKMLENLPNGQQINITNLHINSNNKVTNQVTNKINNKVTNKIVNKINFVDTKPSMFRQDYIGDEKLKELSMFNEDINEELADLYMYEEDNFKNNYKEALIFFEKKTLEFEGFKMLFNELQKNPRNQNARIRKSKSGKCYIYTNNGWEEIPLQRAITKICNKLCNFLYNRETSVNQFIQLVSGSQPKRMSALRKHIEQYIINLNQEISKGDIEIEEIKQIEV